MHFIFNLCDTYCNCNQHFVKPDMFHLLINYCDFIYYGWLLLIINMPFIRMCVYLLVVIPNWSVNKVQIYEDMPLLFQLARQVWRYKSGGQKTVNQSRTKKQKQSNTTHIGQIKKKGKRTIKDPEDTTQKTKTHRCRCNIFYY